MSGAIRLDGRVAIVTGAGGGLGRSHALLLAKRGASVVVNDLDDRVRQVVAEIEARAGRAAAHLGSVTDPASGDGLVQAALDAFGTVDIVVANAGVQRKAPFEDITDVDLDLLLDVHVKGTFRLARAAYRVMKAKGYGRIILTGSDAGMYGQAEAAGYAAAKAAIAGLAWTLAIEGAPYGIRTNILGPLGATGMTPHVTGELARRMDPAQTSGAVVYLASEACDLNHEMVLSGGGGVARIFTATTSGWHAGPGEIVTPEDVRDHLNTIRARDGYHLPGSVGEDVALLLRDLPPTDAAEQRGAT